MHVRPLLFLAVLGCGPSSTSPSSTHPFAREDGALTAGSDAGDATTMPPTVNSFLDLAHVAGGVGACSNTGPHRWTETGCFNTELPPAPSIQRSLVVQHPAHASADANTHTFRHSAPRSLGNQTAQLGSRSSLDGRLNILRDGHEPLIGVLYPENLTRDMQTREAMVAPRTAKIEGGDLVLSWKH